MLTFDQWKGEKDGVGGAMKRINKVRIIKKGSNLLIATNPYILDSLLSFSLHSKKKLRKREVAETKEMMEKKLKIRAIKRSHRESKSHNI